MNEYIVHKNTGYLLKETLLSKFYGTIMKTTYTRVEYSENL